MSTLLRDLKGIIVESGRKGYILCCCADYSLHGWINAVFLVYREIIECGRQVIWENVQEIEKYR